MIVMKFGGSSLASAASIRRVISIVSSEASLHPVIVASAMGDTTDHLLELASVAQKGNSYSAWKLQEAIKEQHFAACEELLHTHEQSLLERFLQDTFRDLHVRILELCEGERIFDKEAQDWIVSLGEQLSSRLLASVLQEHCGDTVHLDARNLIVTNDCFTAAEPLYWETYARIRWTVPIAAREKLVVLGGFIGSTEDGRTTTLGRGGSDLTASIVGAGINAEQIQVWKDVDGMLTCDPRVVPAAHQVKRLSYEEAAELATAGATILHPETMAPAKRLHIPIVIRNTFCPTVQGTTIEDPPDRQPDMIKSIAVKKNVTLLEILNADRADNLDALNTFCRQHASDAAVLFSSERSIYIAVNEKQKVEEQSFASGCLEVRVRSRHAILTFVGRLSDKETMTRKLATAVHGTSAFLIPSDRSSCSIRFAVPEEQLRRCIAQVHSSVFADPDPLTFVAHDGSSPKVGASANLKAGKRFEHPRPFVLATSSLQPN